MFREIERYGFASSPGADRGTLRTFGKTMFFCLCAIGLILFLRHKPACIILWLAGLSFLLCALSMPLALKPIYTAWMALASCLSWFNTRLILAILYYLIITPIGLFARLFGKEFLSLRIQKDAHTYWTRKDTEGKSPESYEKIF